MAICSLANNILRADSCGYVLQSVKKIYLANTADYVSGTSVADDAHWYEIEPAKNTASFTDVLNTTDSGTKYRTHSLSFSIAGTYDEAMQLNLDELSLGSFVGIAVFADGTGVLLGTKNSGLEATVVTNTGAASASEASGISVEMSADLTASALPVSAAEVEALSVAPKA